MTTTTTTTMMMTDDDVDVNASDGSEGIFAVVAFCKATGAKLLAGISRECVVDVLCF